MNRFFVALSVTVLIFFSSLVLGNNGAQSPWERIGQEGFNSVSYITPTRVVAVANEGRILVSDDAGQTWTRQKINTYTDLQGVSFFGSDRGIVIGFQAGEIFFTTNGGALWQSATKSIGGDIANRVEFVSIDTAFVIGTSGRIYRSLDGGKTWNNLNSGTSTTLNNLVFVGSRLGYVVGDSGTILKTTNGGDTWQQQPSGTKWQLLAVDFIDAQNGVAVGLDDPFSNPAGILLKTTDGGQSWVKHLAPDTLVFSVSAVKMIDANRVLVVGTQVMIRTSDAGVSWSASVIPEVLNSGAAFTAVSFLNSTDAFVVGGGGLVMFTKNSGTDWQIKLLSYLGQGGGSGGISNMQFTTGGVGFAIGHLGVYTSLDSGTSWRWQPALGALDAFLFLTDLHFIDRDTGFAVDGSYGNLYRTSDAGESWHVGTTLNSTSLAHLSFADAQNGYLVGDSTIFHTTDNGYSWSRKNPILHLPGKLSFQKITFLKSSGDRFGFLTANYYVHLQSGKDTGYGRVFRTKDGGDTWDQVLQNELQLIHSVFIKNSNTVFAAGAMDVLVRSTDGGDTWSDMHRGTSSRTQYLDINFMNDSIGYVVGFDTSILATTDGGNTWSKEDPWPSDDLIAADDGFNRVLFPYPNTVYLCGEHTFFRKKLSGGPPSVVASSHHEDYDYPGKYLYLVNIPNPASRKTDIQLTGLANLRSFPLSLKIYDLLGLELADLSSQVMDNLSGDVSHAVWDVSLIPSGTYSARISGGPASRVAMIVVVK
jgi:photosystem II stability/assembly factor-like uncharacterized protein